MAGCKKLLAILPTKITLPSRIKLSSSFLNCLILSGMIRSLKAKKTPKQKQLALSNQLFPFKFFQSHRGFNFFSVPPNFKLNFVTDFFFVN